MRTRTRERRRKRKVENKEPRKELLWQQTTRELWVNTWVVLLLSSPPAAAMRTDWSMTRRCESDEASAAYRTSRSSSIVAIVFVLLLITEDHDRASRNRQSQRVVVEPIRTPWAACPMHPEPYESTDRPSFLVEKSVLLAYQIPYTQTLCRSYASPPPPLAALHAWPAFAVRPGGREGGKWQSLS